MSIRSDRRIGLDWIVFLHTFIFLAFWLTNLSFQQAVNEFLSDTPVCA